MNSDTAQALLTKIREKQAQTGRGGVGYPVSNSGSLLPSPERPVFEEKLPLDQQFPHASLEQMLYNNIVSPVGKGLKILGGEISRAYKDAPSASSIGSGISSALSSISNAPYNAVSSAGDLFLKTFGSTRAGELAAAMADARNNAISGAGQADALRRVLLTSLGVGAGAGGLYALYKALQRPRGPKRDDTKDVGLMYPVERIKAGNDRLASILGGMTGFFRGLPARLYGGGVETVKQILSTDPKYIPPGFFGSPQAPSIWDNPLFIPAAAIGGLGAGYVGLRGTNLLTNRIRESAKEEEMRKAKQEFRDALIANYDAPLEHDPFRPQEKNASVNTMTKLSQALDLIYDTLFEKSADSKPGLDLSHGGVIPTAYASALPLYLTLGSLGALATGSLAYDATRASSKAEALKAALLERARQKYNIAPPELYVSPEALDINELKKKPNIAV